MGKTLVEVKVENLDDMFEASKGQRTAGDVRTLTIPNVLVDTGATQVGLPGSAIRQLGLKKFRSRPGRTANGTSLFDIYGMVQITVQGRDARLEVFELPEDSPPLLGQIALEMLDFLVDPVNQRLIGNPEHGGEHMIECFSFFDENQNR